MNAKYASRNDPEAVKQRAMNDPEVAQIMGDPTMRMILEQVKLNKFLNLLKTTLDATKPLSRSRTHEKSRDCTKSPKIGRCWPYQCFEPLKKDEITCSLSHSSATLRLIPQLLHMFPSVQLVFWHNFRRIKNLFNYKTYMQ